MADNDVKNQFIKQLNISIMKNVITLLLAIILIIPATLTSQNSTLKDRSGNSVNLELSKSSVRNKGLEINDGSFVSYKEIHTIESNNFDVYEKLMRKTSRDVYSHIRINFTGDENVYAKRLEKLKERRTGADVARAAGGIMTILGVLSGNRDLAAAGLVTNAAGRVARDINDDRTTDTQNAMLNDLDRRTSSKAPKKARVQSEREILETKYGKENIQSLEQLIDKDHDKAMAYANVASLSDDANQRLASVWLKAMIEKDQGNDPAAEKESEKLVVLEPEMESVEQVKKELTVLMNELNEIRKSEM